MIPVLFIGVSGIAPDELVPVEVNPVKVAPVEIVDPLEVSEFCDPVEATGRSGSKMMPPVFVSIVPVCVGQVCVEPVCVAFIPPVFVVGFSSITGGSIIKGGQTGSTKCPVDSTISLVLVVYEN